MSLVLHGWTVRGTDAGFSCNARIAGFIECNVRASQGAYTHQEPTNVRMLSLTYGTAPKAIAGLLVAYPMNHGYSSTGNVALDLLARDAAVTCRFIGTWSVSPT